MQAVFWPAPPIAPVGWVCTWVTGALGGGDALPLTLPWAAAALRRPRGLPRHPSSSPLPHHPSPPPPPEESPAKGCAGWRRWSVCWLRPGVGGGALLSSDLWCGAWCWRPEIAGVVVNLDLLCIGDEGGGAIASSGHQGGGLGHGCGNFLLWRWLATLGSSVEDLGISHRSPMVDF